MRISAKALAAALFGTVPLLWVVFAFVLAQPGGGGSPFAPEITAIEFRKTIPADGSKVFGTVRFKDADGDISLAKFDVVSAVDFAPFSFNPKVKGQTQGIFQFFVFSAIPQKVTLRVTLIDEAGNKSKAEDFSFEAVTLINFLGKWGSFGTGDGQFMSFLSLALDGASNVYVADFENDSIQKFDSNGTFIGRWGREGKSEGQLDGPMGIAVDPNSGVYVSEAGNHRIQRFSFDGSFLAKWGSFGNGDGQFGWPTRLAVDPNGNVYVIDQWRIFAALGQPRQCCGPVRRPHGHRH